MFMEERQKDILKRVNETGRIQVAQIQELYNISADLSLIHISSKPMEEICIAVGYENVSSFRRKFKKELGITPSQYRNGTEPVTEKSRGESQ